MRSNKKNLLSQRQVIEKKLRGWIELRAERNPQSGWIKAIRGALGMNARQLADMLGTDHAGVLRLEQREQEGKASFESIQKAARAMHCKLIYALVPDENYDDLDSILNERANKLAVELLKKVEHSMRLEKQGTYENMNHRIKKLAEELKANLDPRLWNQPKGENK